MRSVGSLITSLMRIPEVATVEYEPKGGSLRLRFLVAGPVAEDLLAATCNQLSESLQVLHYLERSGVELCAVEHRVEENLAWVEVVRDPATLTVQEVYLVCDLLRERFTEGLVIDGGDPYFVEEQALAHEDLIAEMLADLRRGRNQGPLIALREEGRVLVYRK